MKMYYQNNIKYKSKMDHSSVKCALCNSEVKYKSLIGYSWSLCPMCKFYVCPEHFCQCNLCFGGEINKRTCARCCCYYQS